SKRKLSRRTLLAGFLLSTGILFFAVPVATFLYHAPAPAQAEPEEVYIEIPRGASLRQTGEILFRSGLINGVEGFVVAGKILFIEHQIKPGEYSFSRGMLPVQIISRLREGDVVRYGVTIPEGYSIEQIALLVEEKGLGGAEEFSRLARDPEFTAGLGFPGNTLEGYLFPESYFFTKSTGMEGIIRAMAEGFQAVFDEAMESRARAIGMTAHEVVTLASIIEKETGAPAERKTISSVFHNRLKKRIPLQSDPTVIYSIPDFDGNLTRRHLKYRSPYNTYVVRGLPPGPIASPGRDALLAALYPEDGDYLYFVSRNDGTHYFSKTLAEHNRAVDRYQRKRPRKSTS
ncbi:MAG TPA: endolytic transglycosylase MltG, partial [Nitrospiria bacterium]|nr:endolytic transglycosylase MltG [Nitrospiria bacterium]